MKKEIIHEIESELKVTQESILKAYPSIYAKQDVLQMLNGFVENITRWVNELPEKDSQGPVMSVEGIQDLSEKLIYAISKRIDRLDSNEVVDFDSACFSISYNNTVEIDSLDYNSDTINAEVDAAVDEVLHDYFLTEAPEETETPYATEQ
jgi:hypothetical protein